MTRSRIRSTGPLGSAVVFTFLLGFLSAPLRPCFSHHGHDHGAIPLGADATPASEASADERHAGQHLPHAAHDEPASDAPPDESAPVGCECLGLCQVETSPFLPLGAALAQVAAPAPNIASWRNLDDEPTAGSPHAVPLARGPPPLA